jgi:plasmid maintenance system antidote protein VapI
MNEQNISVAGMHRSTGMSETHIAGVLIGDTGVTLRTIERFAKVFGCQPWEMIK